MTTNKNAQAAATPPPVNYATLQADVAEWQEDYVQYIREIHGAEVADETEADLKANPWMALKWYVEDNQPAVQGFLEVSPVADPAEDADGDDQFNPEFREVEVGGETVVYANTDASIQMMANTDTPEARGVMEKYHDALAALKEANGGTSTMFMREEAFQTAMGQVGIEVEVTIPSQGATQ